MWKKMAISMGKQYLFLILEVWAQEAKRLGNNDVKNVKKGIETLIGVLILTNSTSVTGEEVAQFLDKL